MTAIWVRLGGQRLADVGTYSPPTWETLADGGCGMAELTVTTSRTAPHHLLRTGTILEIVAGAMGVYKGEVTEYDPDTGGLHAAGLSTSLYRRLALDNLGQPTRNPAVAIWQAAVRGWQGTDPHGVTVNTDIPGTADGHPTSVGELLDDWAEAAQVRWGVDGLGQLYAHPIEPAEPKWLASPGVAAFGATDEGSPTMLAGAYVDSLGALRTAFAGSSGIEEHVDLTGRGVLNQAQAEAVLAGLLALRGGRGWVNSVSLTPDEITNSGGAPAYLPGVVAGDTLRTFGVGYVTAGSMTLDAVIGKTVHTAGSRLITLEPVNTAPRSFADVLAAQAAA